MKNVLISALFAVASATFAQTDFHNTDDTRIPGIGTSGSALPYPLTFTVSGMASVTTDINITLTFGTAPSTSLISLGEEHSFAGDLDVMLVAPSGTNIVFFSDVGSFGDLNGAYTFDDEAATSILPDGAGQIVDGDLVNGSYRYSAVVPGDPFAAGAPTPVFENILFSVFDGENPNGVWSLYIMDDAGGDAGWLMDSHLTVTAVPEPASMVALTCGVAAWLRRPKRPC